jgi:hypothetical protein
MLYKSSALHPCTIALTILHEEYKFRWSLRCNSLQIHRSLPSIILRTLFSNTVKPKFALSFESLNCIQGIIRSNLGQNIDSQIHLAFIESVPRRAQRNTSPVYTAIHFRSPSSHLMLRWILAGDKSSLGLVRIVSLLRHVSAVYSAFLSNCRTN